MKESRGHPSPILPAAAIAVALSLTALAITAALALHAVARTSGSAGSFVHGEIAGAYLAVLAVWLAALLVSLLVVWRSTARLRSSLGEILETSRLFAAGRLDAPLRLAGSPLLVEVAEALNRMAGEVTTRFQVLTRQRNEQKAIFSGMAEAVIVLSASLDIIETNPAASDLTGLRPEEAKGRSLIDVVRNAELHSFARQTLTSDEPREALITIGPSPPRHFEVHGTVLRRDPTLLLGGAPDRLVLVLHDITKIKNLEDIRRDFVANVSHELKTPLTSIKGFVETLKDGAMADPEAALRFLGIIERQTARMEAIVEDLLSLSRLEQGEGNEVELTLFAAREAIQSAIEVCADRAARRSIAIQISCPETLQICGNLFLIEQAIVNLVDNAVKYSAEGASVEVAVEEHGRWTEIVVRDHGIGIPQRELPRIFERFYRVDKARSRELGGTGLGLAIVKHIALAHRGEVLVESTPGLGSAFTLRLPGGTSPE